MRLEKVVCPITEIVKQVLNQKSEYSDSEVDQRLNSMTKLELMDHYLEWHGGMVSSNEVCTVVKQVFGFDLEMIPILSVEKIDTFEPSTFISMDACTLIDSYLNHYANRRSGDELRGMIDHFFGVNLDGIVSLENKRISLFSKGLWGVQHEQDLFLIHAGLGDIDVRISVTDYFTAQTGLKKLPSDVQQALLPLGYTYEEDMGSAYFSTFSDQPVLDSFKGRTIGTILEVIDNSYSHL